MYNLSFACRNQQEVLIGIIDLISVEFEDTPKIGFDFIKKVLQSHTFWIRIFGAAGPCGDTILHHSFLYAIRERFDEISSQIKSESITTSDILMLQPAKFGKRYVDLLTAIRKKRCTQERDTIQELNSRMLNHKRNLEKAISVLKSY